MTQTMERERLYRRAWLLALATVFYNMLQGVVSVAFGWEDDAFTLAGIGLIDSAGTLLIALLSWREGRESLGKARGKACSCCCGGPT